MILFTMPLFMLLRFKTPVFSTALSTMPPLKRHTVNTARPTMPLPDSHLVATNPRSTRRLGTSVTAVLALALLAAIQPSALLAATDYLSANTLAAGPNTPGPALEEILVEGRRLSLVGHARSASEGVVGQMDLAIRPLLRPGDVLEAVPGLIVTQHSGSGKSNQLFLRGFNLDHGTDFATWIDGMPVNMRTHGHGQGYTDINFVIPETLESIRFVKGPYHAELGDFSSAGGAHLRTFAPGDSTGGVPRDLQLKIGLGENGFQRTLIMGHSTHRAQSTQWAHSISGALELQRYDGPWQNVAEDVHKTNGLLKWALQQGAMEVGLTAMHYDNRWQSADQIPARALAQGLLTELGSLDTTLGGESRRSSLSGQVLHQGQNSQTHLSAYYIDYTLQLWSNFTYLLDNPTQGDQFEQGDDRGIWGANGLHRWQRSADSPLQHSAGFDLRYDDIARVGLYATAERARLETIREDAVQQGSLGVFYELNWQVNDAWRALLGVRADHYRFDVDAGLAANRGSANDSLISPKASVLYRSSDTTEWYISSGRGFHSNDARGTTITVDPRSGEAVPQVDPLVASRGLEVGVKTQPLAGWNSALAIWRLSLDSELLFVGDAGTTEASRPSRRWGVEWNNFWAITDRWSIEADLAWTESRFSDRAPEGREIPGAIPLVVAGALTYSDTTASGAGWFGSLRLRHFEDYALIEDDSVRTEGSTLVNLSAGWQNSRWRLQIDALNLLDSNDHDIDYFYASRLAKEPEQGIEDRHFKVFEPRQLRAHLTLTF